MFAEAYKVASQYTFPILVSSRFYDGTVESGVGSFVIINSDGWFVTAAHILAGLQTHNLHLEQIKQFNNSTLTADTNVPDPKWITNHSLWFGADQHIVRIFHVLADNDLAIGQIENYNSAFVKQYPVFKNPNMIIPGTSLCKLGFPFYDMKASFDNNSFRFDPSVFPIPMFPMDGMMTRNLLTGKSPDGLYDYKWLETTSPGLKGQSGGPTFDKEGKIWGIQSQTRHMPLGFSPKIQRGTTEVEENQFLNVGWGVHVETIIKFLQFHKVRFDVD
jgi:hypothetical protein